MCVCVCVHACMCVCAGGQQCMQISITSTEIMLFSALLNLKIPKNLNSGFDE